MLYPQLEQPARTQEYVQEWRGYNRNLRCGDGEFWDMGNMTGDLYPILSPRKRRSRYETATGRIRGLYVKGGHVIWVAGSQVFVDGDAVSGLTIPGDAYDDVQIVGIGVYVVVFPSGRYFDLVAFLGGGSFDNGQIYIGREISCGDGTIAWFDNAKADGTEYASTVFSEPQSPTGSELWLDSSGEETVGKIWNSGTASWIVVQNMYIKISCTGIGAGFEAGDSVTISGAMPQDTTGEIKNRVNGNFVLESCGDDWIVIPGMMPVGEMRMKEGNMTVERQVPEMDYVVECGNRLWGCKYGKIVQDGKLVYVNEIYASALGDFKQWKKFQGLSTDSYAASRGSDGPWTGAITYQGHPTFFKEDCIETVYPSSTGAHQITVNNCRGLQRSYPGNSLAIVNDVLYWYTGREVVAYDGNYPVSVSAALGQEIYDGSAAGALGSKYYICLKRETGCVTFAYDTRTGMWHKEDEGDLQQNEMTIFAGDISHLYYANNSNEIWDIAGTGADLEPEPDWYVETGEIGLTAPGNKYISRINLRLLPKKGAWADVYVQYDSNEQWEHKGHIRGTGYLLSKLLPIVPRRCDHMKIRIEGHGDVRVYSMGRLYEEGSDLF